MVDMRNVFLPAAFLLLAMMLITSPASGAWSNTVYEKDSLYHHIRVVDEGGSRMLRFDNSVESQMSKSNPFMGHFEYIDYFFQSWVLKQDIENCLMLGLGGASAPKLMQHYFQTVEIDVAEIDEMVYDVATEYFYFNPSDTTEVTIQDARVFLRKSDEIYDLIIMDAYTSNKYGSYIPFHLATEEFFDIVDEHLSDDGIFAFNVIGQIYGDRKDIVASIYHTLSKVFPNIYLFPADESLNVVMIASKSSTVFSKSEWTTTASRLVNGGFVGTYPKYLLRASNYTDLVPTKWWEAQVLTDDYAPVDGLLR
jgi:spermidine synthase